VAAASGLANPEVRLARKDHDELVHTIRAEADRLDRLVGNLLDLSRLRSGVALPRAALWPVDELVGRAIEELGPAGDRVAVELDADGPPVGVDALQIERALVNLLDNALKFSDATVTLHVQPHGETVLLHVLDAGPGLVDRESVFEPFKSSGDRRGAGLGLAIARGFAEANGARVWAEESRGGAHFVLELPVAARAPVPA
jgi:two-component system sensor histidine kinase KdpD